MAYDVNTITAKGAELLAAATAADKLILDGCDATTTFIDAATAALVETRPATALSNTTTVSIISATTNHVIARASFILGTNTGGDANTLYLYGHKESAPTDIYVIYVASSQESFHLPEVGDVANVYETLFDMIYSANADAVTTAGTSTYCTLAEFNLLKNRTVTTHIEGDNTEGEEQTILGDKYFSGFTQFFGESHCYGESYISNGLYVFPVIRVTAYDSGIAKITRIQNIMNNTNLGLGLVASNELVTAIDNAVDNNQSYYIRHGEYDVTPSNITTLVSQINAAGFTCNALSGSDIGASASPFGHIYATDLTLGGNFSMGGDLTVTGDVNASGEIYGNAFIGSGVTCYGDGTFESDLNVQGGISADTIEPYTDQGVGVAVGKVGSFNYPFSELHAAGLCMLAGFIGIQLLDSNYPIVSTYYGERTIDGVTYNTVISRASLTTDMRLMTDGTANGCVFAVELNDIERLNISYNSVTSQYETTVSTLLKASGGFTGTQPTYSDSTRQVKVGSILVVVFATGMSAAYTGQEYHSTSSAPLKFAKVKGYLDSNIESIYVTASDSDVPDGTYALLNDVDPSESKAWCLVQCVSLD